MKKQKKTFTEFAENERLFAVTMEAYDGEPETIIGILSSYRKARLFMTRYINRFGWPKSRYIRARLDLKEYVLNHPDLGATRCNFRLSHKKKKIGR